MPRHRRLHLLPVIIGLICAFLLADVAATPPQLAAAQAPTPPLRPATALDDLCQLVLERAQTLTEQKCQGTGRNQACYGYVNVARELRPDAGEPPNRFTQSGDMLGLRYLTRIRTEPFNPDDSSWGMAVLKMQANLPDTNPGQNVTFVLFGDTDVRPGLNHTNSVYLSTGLGKLSCNRLPASGVVVRAPGKLKVAFTVNDVQITIASTVLLRNGGAQMAVTNIEGAVEVRSQGVTQVLQPGQASDIPMNGTQANGVPSAPYTAPIDAALDSLVATTIRMDGDAAAFSGPITLTGTIASIDPSLPAITVGGYQVRVGGVSDWATFAAGDEVIVEGQFEAYYVVAQRITRVTAVPPTPTPTLTPEDSATPSVTPTPSATIVGLRTSTATATHTASPSLLPTETQTASATASPTPLPTDTYTPAATASPLPSRTPTETDTDLPTETATSSATSTQSATPALVLATRTPTVTDTAALPPSNTPPPPDPATQTPAPVSTLGEMFTETPTPTATLTPTPTPTPTVRVAPTQTPTPTPTPTATSGSNPSTITLTALCSVNPEKTRRWRVWNPFPEAISVNWVVYGTILEGELKVSPTSAVIFETLTQPGANTMQLFYLGRMVDVKASSSAPCTASKSSAEDEITLTATPSAMPTFTPSGTLEATATLEPSQEPTFAPSSTAEVTATLEPSQEPTLAPSSTIDGTADVTPTPTSADGTATPDGTVTPDGTAEVLPTIDSTNIATADGTPVTDPDLTLTPAPANSTPMEEPTAQATLPAP